ncbi:MAG: 50S ribosomal protein L30 [Myxococcales bacterium]|jgi:large subunit ribosomal protein L30
MPGIKVKLVRSRAGRSKDQLATLKGLGLYRLNQERILPDTPQTLGMCRKLQHMVAWERVNEEPVKRPRRAAKPAEQAASN